MVLPKIRVAVTGVGGASGQSIVKALHSTILANFNVEVWPADVMPSSTGLHTPVRNTHALGTLMPKPEENIDAWADWMLENGIEVLIPGADRDLLPFAQVAHAWYRKHKLRIIVSSPEAIKVADDKLSTSIALQEMGLPVPRGFGVEDAFKTSAEWMEIFTELGSEFRWPLIIKPRRDAASRDFHILKDVDDLLYHVKRVKDPIVQEYIDGDEYTCAIMFDKYHRPGARFILKRWLYAGSTYKAEAGDFPEVEVFMKGVAKHFVQSGLGFTGPVNVQLRWGIDGPKILEVNARCSGSTAIRAHWGYNEPQMILNHWCLKNPINQPRTKKGFTMRYFDEVHLPDTTEEDLRQIPVGGKGYNGKIPSWL